MRTCRDHPGHRCLGGTHNVGTAPELPKVTDWIQAWGGVGGVFAGLAAASAAALLLMFERNRADTAGRQLADERAEAALNVARAGVVTDARFGGYGGDEEPHINDIHNYGSSPLRNVVAVVSLPTSGNYVIQAYEVMGPGEEQQVQKKLKAAVRVAPPWKFRAEKAPVAVCFIDHANQAWQRTSGGGVTRTTMLYPLVTRAEGVDDASGEPSWLFGGRERSHSSFVTGQAKSAGPADAGRTDPCRRGPPAGRLDPEQSDSATPSVRAATAK
ncbi:hypothetical protein GCM10009828_008660 [Actinoplanes couchii]|uniref:Flp pilus-assembly TadG-like N-terminal domain-containing protein n=1 Tax=Actinoplanes couchii TaxID=403638 RepID=A0ABQ3XIH2_9ACTN|nr:hypothetical protein Aco03nite_067110 [Actinoplanes couchii]